MSVSDSDADRWPDALIEAINRVVWLRSGSVSWTVKAVLDAAVAWRDDLGNPAIMRHETAYPGERGMSDGVLDAEAFKGALRVLANWRGEGGHDMADAWDAVTAHDAVLRAERDALRTALQTYGQHLADCDYWGTGLLPGAMKPDESRCDCGLGAALAAPVAPDRRERVMSNVTQTTDAAVWTDEFMRLFGDRKEDIDWGLMVGWFANAIETGRAVRERPSVEFIAGMISTIEFTPSAEHPAACLPIAQAIVDAISEPPSAPVAPTPEPPNDD